MENKELEKGTVGAVVDVVDIEEYSSEHEDGAPEARIYVILVDRHRYRVEKRRITGREILALADKTPESHKLYQHFRGGRRAVIGPDQIVDLREPGIERFTTLPKDAQEGSDLGRA